MDPRSRIGFYILILLISYGMLALGVLTMWGVWTYPSIGDVSAVIGAQTTDQDRVAVYRDLRADWLSTIKDLGLTFTITPVLTLLGTVIGYIFRGTTEDAEKQVDAEEG